VLRNRECMAQHPASQAACFVDNRAIVLAFECHALCNFISMNEKPRIRGVPSRSLAHGARFSAPL